MHVLQRIAVQAEDKDEAFRRVKNDLEELMGDSDSSSSWYDWFIAGGGRWNPNGDQYNDNDQSMTISYAEEPDKFISEVNSAIEGRIEEFNQYRKQFADTDINASLDKYDGQMDFSFDLYPLGKMIDIMQGKWDFNSYFFDMHHDSTNTMHMLKSIDNGDKNWFLIFVDFHF